ncbi:AAA family ATPase [Aestuariimicrobium ganziense]|uniref:AAA family ATPase n=1 Tax=Aestuariimicrobium ganziense TaxID=2773677 RepID=UPI0019448356|nr:AAA family ATPase [Aestuariimicrobium ganziense]
MLTTLAVHGYRSLREVVLPLAPVTVVTGANGVGKSSLYRSLRLLSETGAGRLVSSLAHDGGLQRVLWAGPETVTRAMRTGEVPVQGTGSRRAPISLMLGFASDEFGYLVDIGLPIPSQTAFSRDPVLKREVVFAGPLMRPATTLVQRKGSRVLSSGEVVLDDLSDRLSLLSELGDPLHHPEVRAVRHELSGWRFYDSFRTDPASPARQSAVGTWTPVLADDGADLAPAIQTILESAWATRLTEAVAEAFPGGQLDVAEAGGRFELVFTQRGLLRALNAAELSDGTLRFLLLAAALLSPRPPRLLVLNEPETSLHPQVLPVVAELVSQAAARTQVVVVSHSDRIVQALAVDHADQVVHHELRKEVGETVVADQGLLSRPPWNWGSR